MDFVWNRSLDKIKHLPKDEILENLDEFDKRYVSPFNSKFKWRKSTIKLWTEIRENVNFTLISRVIFHFWFLSFSCQGKNYLNSKFLILFLLYSTTFVLLIVVMLDLGYFLTDRCRLAVFSCIEGTQKIICNLIIWKDFQRYFLTL